MKKVLILFLAAVLLAGCSSGFVYQRKANPSQDGPKLPVKVAVVAFEDRTRDFTSEGNIFSGHIFNLARTDINGVSLNILFSAHLGHDIRTCRSMRPVT